VGSFKIHGQVIGDYRGYIESFIQIRDGKKPCHSTTTDFFTAMNAEHHRYALRCLQARQPSFKTSS
jgi:hypothetical protein